MGKINAAANRLQREYAALENSKPKQLVARPREGNILEWHYMVHDMPAPYLGGQYHGKLVFPSEYPLKPPAIYMVTPSGRFEINTKLCLSMSDFHPESWNPSWRVESILMGLISFMLDKSEPRTSGGVHMTEAQRQKYARESFHVNKKNKLFCEIFPEFLDEEHYVDGVGWFMEKEQAEEEAKKPRTAPEAADKNNKDCVSYD